MNNVTDDSKMTMNNVVAWVPRQLVTLGIRAS
jgi:hypothetical protein